MKPITMMAATTFGMAALLLSPVAGGSDGAVGLGMVGSARAADSYDWTKPRGSIHSRRRSPNLWSGQQPYKSPLFQKPSRNYGIPTWRSNRGGINPYDKPRKNYGGWGYRH